MAQSGLQPSRLSTPKMVPRMRVRAPSHASRANLDSEFSDKTSSPFPYHPPNLLRTPDHRRPQSESLRTGLGWEATPHVSKSHLSPSNQKRWNPAANLTETFVPGTLPQFPPNFDQTPNHSKPYDKELTPWSWNDATPALLKTPSRRHSLTQRGEPCIIPQTPTERWRQEWRTYDTTPTQLSQPLYDKVLLPSSLVHAQEETHFPQPRHLVRGGRVHQSMRLHSHYLKHLPPIDGEGQGQGQVDSPPRISLPPFS